MSVAIRTITRLQDSDDAPTLGAGQDGYALTWDNASGAFVATAVSGVYLPLTGGTLTGAIKVPQSADATGLAIRGHETQPWGIRFYSGSVVIHGGSSGSVTLWVSGSGVAFGGAIQLNNGSVSSPATYFSSSTSTGIFRSSAAHGLGIAVAGVEQFRVENGLFGSLNNATTSAVDNLLTLTHNTSGTAAAGFGAGLAFNLQSSTTASQPAGRIILKWNDPTHATRSAIGQATAYYTSTEHTPVTWGANSSGALLSFYDVTTPIARQVLATGAGASVDNVISALQALGLVKQS